MRRLLVNALSVTNQSGAHVLLGHISYLMDQLQGDVRLIVLCREDMDTLHAPWGDRVDWVFAPVSTRGWLSRALWERRFLVRIVRDRKVDAYFTPSGVAAARLPIPQIVFCQNPWALVPAARRLRDAPKAWLQRLAYRQTMRVAEAVIFNSRFMQQAYRANAGRQERMGAVVYQAPGEETQRHAAEWGNVTRKPGQIVCASAMGPHKNVETVIRAFHHLRTHGYATASLILVGGWPDAAYERQIREMVKTLRLENQIRFAGFVPREELDRYLAESQVFCLMSRCESFGIPAIEAQLFGTPVISSNVCAVPEICGDGGWFYDPDDWSGVAEGMARLLGDAETWTRLSEAARRNAGRYSWVQCSPGLVDVVRTVLAMRVSTPISVVILSHNEAINLPRCIEAVQDCAEVVVLDDGSTDGSQAIARSCGARVVEHPYRSFADQRNWAMENAGLKFDWGLHLDADEVMTPAALQAIADVLPVLRPEQVGWIARKVMLEDRWLRFSADYPVHVPRLVHREGPRFVMRGHGEIIDASPDTAFLLKEPLLHYAFSKGWPDWYERHQRYARAEADRIRQGLPPISGRCLFSPDRATRRAAMRALSYRLPCRPAMRFLYAYILHMGFLDGRQGFLFCRAMAAYERMITRHMRQLQSAAAVCMGSTRHNKDRAE